MRRSGKKVLWGGWSPLGFEVNIVMGELVPAADNLPLLAVEVMVRLS